MHSRADSRRRARSAKRRPHRLAGGIALALPAVLPSVAAELPVPCVAGSCGAAAPSWVSSGAASGVVAGTTFTVSQASSNATLNWQSFNISSDGKVVFQQPDAAAVALNRIFQNDPSRIFGALQSNGRIYLLNQNGIVFGASSQVNVGALLASTLDITPAALQRGIAGAADLLQPAFRPFVDASGNPQPSGAVRVEPGARLSAPQGQILLFAPEVTNLGSISTPDGQTILAAGQRIFLLASSDPNLRGLLVEVGSGGTVTNGAPDNSARSPQDLLGQLSADRGNVTLAGAAVNQLGRVSATTSVRAAGSIRLQARDTPDPLLAQLDQLEAPRGGTLTFGSNSVTEVVLPATDTDKTVDVNVQPRSSISGMGKDVSVLNGARLTATGGSIDLTAAEVTDTTVANINFSSTPDASRLFIDNGARLDVSGATIDLPVERNSLTVELRGSQLQDSPLQRNGPLRGQTVSVDLRQHGTRADGSTWQGSPLADLSGDISTIQRSVQERNLAAGQISLQSQGAVLIARGATLDVSGGVINWQPGYVRATQLLGSDGKLYDMAHADPSRSYIGIADSQTVQDLRWGVSVTNTYSGLSTSGTYQAGYAEGKDAGTVSVLAPQVVLDGHIVGTAVAGPYQRNPTSGSAATGALRPFDQVPLGATLVIGAASAAAGNVVPDFVAGDAVIGTGFALPAFGTGSGSSFDPLHDALPAALTSTLIRADLLGGTGVANLGVFANGTVDVKSRVTLPAGGSVSLTGGRVHIEADISAASGTITAVAEPTISFTAGSVDLTPALSVAGGAKLVTAGEWVNDNPLLSSGATAPLWLDGGQISLAARLGNFSLGGGSVLDVSGGAHRLAGGSIVAGRGGAISLLSSAVGALAVANPVEFDLGATLRGYALSSGGSLSITTNGICLAAGACRAAAGVLTVDPDELVADGFGSISLGSDLFGVTLAPDTAVSLLQRNYRFSADPSAVASGADFARLVEVTTLPLYQRRPVNLSLAAAGAAGSTAYADLSLAAGSQISADPGATITLRSDSRVLADGHLVAPGGTINLRVDTSPRFKSYLADQGVWLGPDAFIDVAGTSILQPSDLGLNVGSVLAGGTVSLTAQRGYIVTLPGSLIDVSGAQASLDTRSPNGSISRQLVGSSGGTAAFAAVEGMLLNGAMRARGGGSTNAGGSLTVTLDPGAPRSIVSFPASDRTIDLAASLAPVVVAPGSAVPATYNGVARLPASLVTDAGFDSVSLTARNLFYPDPSGATADVLLGGYGRVNVEPGVVLNPRARLVIDSPGLQMNGAGTAQLSSAYVALGDSDPTRQQAPAPVSGDGSISVRGAFIDLVGQLAVGGVSQLTLDSVGDVRARGVFSPDSQNYLGGLDIAAPLTITAQQIYPSTLTQYHIDVASAPGARLSIAPAGGVAADVLSAGGRLQLNAPQIDISGTVRAPLGEIDVQAPVISVAKTGILSTSLEGLTVPFGQTQGGQSYTYQLDGNITRVYGVDGVPLPSQRVLLSGNTVDLASGSTIDVRGGGSLSAYEFLPGLGGTRDVLSPAVRPNQFAVLPGLNAVFTPFDPHESPGSALKPGDDVFLYGGSGLPAGQYTLLPARYALLPGAYLVTTVGGYQDLAPGERVAQLDGSMVVAGYRTIAGTPIRDSRTSGFDVTPGATALTQASYTVTDAGTFLGSQASALGVAAPRLPQDAGTAVFAAAQQLFLNGSLRASAPAGGHGATVELTSNRIEIDAADAPAVQGVLSVSAQRLSALGAESLVIGGTRQPTAAGFDLDTTSSDVVVATGAQLDAPDVLLTALNQVTVQTGASVSATGPALGAAAPLQLSADAVLLRASTGAPGVITRSGVPSAPAQLSTEAGSLIAAGTGSITIDAAENAQMHGALQIAGGSLVLASQHIGLGTVPAAYPGLAYDPSSAQGGSAGALILRGRQSVDLFGALDFSGANLTLDTPQLQAASDATQARLTAQALSIGASVPAVNPPLATSGGASLALSANTVSLTGGSMAASGFAQTSLVASGEFVAVKTTTLTTPGDLTVRAGLISSASGATLTLTSGGAVSLAAAGAAGAGIAPASIGGAVHVEGATVSDAARIAVPGGRIELLARSADLTLSDGAVLDVSGRRVQFDTVGVSAPGGTIALTAATGNITASAGADINVTAAGADGRSGSVTVSAPQGSAQLATGLHGAAANAGLGGRFSIVAQSLDFSQLQGALAEGGFTGGWDFALRGPGDLVVSSGQTVTTSALHLAADQGSVVIAGRVDAAADRGGAVLLAARDTITVSGVIDAYATRADARGGRVELDAGGAALLGSGSLIDVSGTVLSDPALSAGGQVTLRLPRTAVTSVLDTPGSAQLTLSGSIRGAREVTIEGVARYQPTNGVIDATATAADPGNLWFADALTFAARAQSVLNALGVAGSSVVSVRPGIEVWSPGDLTLASAWNMHDWRFNGAPGTMTLRAAGNLLFAGSLSDGFTAVTGPGAFALQDQAPSWSYRLAGGALLASADPLAVRAAFEASTLGGDVTIAPGTISASAFIPSDLRLVRTGTGRIDVAAAEDFVLGNEASVLYTAGIAGPGIRLTTALQSGGLGGLAYPVNGGDIAISAGRDVLGAPSSQFVTDWQLRAGRITPFVFGSVATAWAPSFDRFHQGLATLGGGSLSVLAGGNIVDLSASTPTTGRQIGGTTPATSVVLPTDGGDLTVRAGGDLIGGKFTVEGGSAGVLVGGSVVPGHTVSGSTAVGPVFATDSGTITLEARGSINVGTIVNPTLVPVSPSVSGLAPVFGTYGPDSSVSIAAAGGSVLFGADTTLVGADQFGFGNYPSGLPGLDLPLRVLPPTLSIASLSGSVRVAGPYTLWPAPRGDLALLAADSVILQTDRPGTPLELIMSDADPTVALPSVVRPANGLGSYASLAGILGTTSGGSPLFNAATPIHGAGRSSGAADPVPALLVALNGDVAMQPDGQGVGVIYIPKPVHVVAGQDIFNLGLRIQQNVADDVSTLSAGRDVTWATGRDAAGNIVANPEQITVAGPGELEVSAGRNVDLRASAGITSEGNVRNPALPAGGASISVLAGLNGVSPAYDAFIQRYLASSDSYDAALIAYVQRLTGAASAPTKADALAQLRSWSREQQRPLLEQLLFAALRSGGRAAAQPGPTFGNFQAAFDALTTYLPHSNPDPGAGEKNPYAGDIRLFLSRIYTLSGGDINLLAPGGLIDVGIATPPAAFGLPKPADQFGIVVQSSGSVSSLSYGDFQVNQSRVFAANGGDILVWSTRGDIDAGRGAKTAISAPPPVITIDSQGQTKIEFPPALTGSGIQTLATSVNTSPGDVDLFAPHGVVNANDAGIVAGNLTIAATAVLGASNIKVTGVSVGVPVETGGLGASLASASAAAGSATAAATSSVSDTVSQAGKAPLAEAALGWLDVFIEGFGEEVCKPSDAECLQRNRKR